MRARRAGAAAILVAVGVLVLTTSAAAQLPTTDDPRFGLSPGWFDAGTASLGLELLAFRQKPAGFFTDDPSIGAQIVVANSDLAFQGNFAYVGNFNGFNIYDISNPSNPTLQTSVVCPGGQGDLSVYGDLLFMSVEEARARIDCAPGGSASLGTPDPDRFRGVRIFNIANPDAPAQVAAVQTCRGSHTHTLVEAPEDPAHVYIYVSGTSGVRSTLELATCSTGGATTENPSLWRIEVIKVPVANPAAAGIASEPRLFRDEATGALNGLQNGPQTPQHPCASATPACGPGTGATGGATWSPTPNTNHCHDITVFPALKLAAGACSGNGLLIDISDPANPARIDAVADPLWAYWHGATFSNDGTKVIFTDEWGGGTQPRCRAADQLPWGGNAIYEIVDRKLVFRSYNKLPVAQSLQENCVTHIPSVVPVPGRDILIQAYYQGGASMVDVTDPRNPTEIGYFDRGPISGSALVLGGLWSTYWYNGETYGSEIGRGLDVYGLTPTPDMTANEIAAAREVRVPRLNVQYQQQYVHEPSFAVARAYRDQLVRADLIDAETLANVDKFLDRAERFQTGPTGQAAKANLLALGNALKSRGEEFANLSEVLIALGRG